MSFTNYTIVPVDEVVVIDGVSASGVSMAGIPANIHIIQWYGLRNIGTIEYVIDPLTGILPAPGSFTDPSIYQAQLDGAQEVIYARENPQIYYSTIDENLYQGALFGLGSAIYIFTPNTPQPAYTTSLVPPTPASFQTLYWFEDAWVVSGVDPSLSLGAAKSYLVSATLSSVAANVDNQSRIYSTLELVTHPDPGTLPCADNSSTDLATYQATMDSEATLIINQINAATDTIDLYSLNPNVNPIFS